MKQISISELFPNTFSEGFGPVIVSVESGYVFHEILPEIIEQVIPLISKRGAVIIRGLRINGNKQFADLLTGVFQRPLLEYTYRSTPRRELRNNIYTSTEYHHDKTIAQHNENAYSNKWPFRLGFYCVRPSEQGGQTPITDSHDIYASLPSELVNEFEQRKLKYVRNYSDMDLSWQDVFGTDSRSWVEDFCNKNRIEFQWFDNNKLRTSQILSASQLHPVTGKKVWFNQAHLFHYSNLGDEISNVLLRDVGEQWLPRNCYFADGGAINIEHLNVIRQRYENLQVQFDWQPRDVMLLDNLRFSHGRNPYKGTRKVLVGMA